MRVQSSRPGSVRLIRKANDRRRRVDAALTRMRRVPACLVAAFASAQVLGCPHELSGSWQSDKAATVAYNTENTRLAPQATALLDAILGRMTLTFEGGQLHVIMPDVEVGSSAEGARLAGFEEHKAYAILFCNDSSIAWSGKQPFGNGQVVSVFHFVDADTFWVYSGTSAPDLPDLHLREFFRRLR